MPELYQSEEFIYRRVPIEVFNHSFKGTDIYTVLHWHRNIEFNLTTEGRIRATVDGVSQDQYPSDWYIVNSGELHGNRWIGEDDIFKGVTVQISKEFIDSWLGEGIRFSAPSSESAKKEIEAVLRQFGEYLKREDTDDLEKMELVFRFMQLLKKYCISEQQTDRKREKLMSSIREIVNYIDENYTDEIDLNSTAEQFHYSPAHLSRMFKEHIGFNFHAYLQSVRVMHSVEDMKKDPQIRLIDVSSHNGFPNVKSFITAFKKTFGCTPSEWLKNRNNS